MELTQEYLKCNLHYDEKTGEFFRKGVKNKMAGTIHSRGYVQISVGGQRYLAHRLAWLYVYGHFPLKQTDHINGIKGDNRIVNLREATQSQNLANRKKFERKILPKGVHESKRKVGVKYVALIMYKKKQLHLGTFKTIEEAAHCYDTKAKEIYGDFAKVSR